MSDEFIDASGEEGSDINEEQQLSSPPTNSMAALERKKQKETRQFASRLLADINTGTINGVQVKREAGDEQDGTAANNAEFILPRVSDVVKKCLEDKDFFVNEVYYPVRYEGDIHLSEDMNQAKKFEFLPDAFQNEAIKCLDYERNLIVSAHTSAGKTLIAIYAIALALRQKKRAIYTTPIKALSNQKYQQLAAEFPNIGLLTGDVCIHPDADCLVMTTEILRNKLYQQDPEILKNLEWVVFDEIHYMQDKERGVVWEESIILLPQETKMVFLSATIPNASEFAKWIAYFRQQLCHLIYTVKRPIPLIHYIFPSKSDQLFKIVQNNRFLEDNFGRAMEFLTESVDPIELKNVRKSMGTNEAIGKDNFRKLIRTVNERNCTPCLVFSFSRIEVEKCASQIKQMDFNSEEEKSEIRFLFENSIAELAEEERNLDQISQMLIYFLHGIGVHHSGLLPIVKEIVEILFAQGLIKVLIATETFAMGVNMPAKAVIFTSARKFDGQTNRWLTNGEYVQMSGRAGRRDQKRVERGIVILMTDQQMEMDQVKEMMLGHGDRLESKYRLTFNMILNQIRINPDATILFPKTLLANTFLQWQSICSANSLKSAMKEKKLEWESMVVDDDAEDQLRGIKAKMDKIEQLDKAVKKIALVPHRVVPFLNPGRLLKIKHFEKDYDWGVLVDWEKVRCPVLNSNEMIYILHMAVMLAPESVRRLPSLESVRPPGPSERAALAVIPFTFECIRAVSPLRLKMPEELLSREGREALGLYLQKTKERFNGVIPELHPMKELHACEPKVIEYVNRMETFEEDLRKYPLKQRRNYDDLFQQFKEKQRVEKEYKEAEKRYEESTKLVLRDELHNRIKVLSDLSFLYPREDGQKISTKKGLVACEICSGDELVLTELLFNCNSPFQRMEPSEIAAILSCFVFDEPAYSTKDLSPMLMEHFQEVQDYIKKMAKYQKDNGIKLDTQKYVEQFSSGMINVVYRWCEKEKWEDVLKKTQLYEGSIVRCFRRLDQLLCEMISATQVDNNSPELTEKFAIARRSLRRGTPFISSLYT